MNPSKTLTATLAGLLALGGSLGIGVQVAGAQDQAPAETEHQAPDGEGNGRQHRRGHGNRNSTVVLDLLGIDQATLTEAREAGTTLVDLAATYDVSEAELIAALVADATDRINAKVAEQGLDQAKADEKLAELETRITDKVNNVRPERSERDSNRTRGENRGGSDGMGKRSNGQAPA